LKNGSVGNAAAAVERSLPRADFDVSLKAVGEQPLRELAVNA
jgi:hypothetical protein